jgi:hypothetical protein
VAPKPRKLCLVTLTASPDTFSENILSKAAQTALFT